MTDDTIYSTDVVKLCSNVTLHQVLLCLTARIASCLLPGLCSKYQTALPRLLWPFTADSTIVLLGHTCQCPTSTRFRRQTNEQTNRRTSPSHSAHALRRCLNNVVKQIHYYVINMFLQLYACHVIDFRFIVLILLKPNFLVSMP